MNNDVSEKMSADLSNKASANGVYLSKKGFVNRNVWWDIERSLGAVTHFEIIQHEQDELTEIKYTSKGVEKSIYVNGADPHASMTPFIQSYLYCMKEWAV